MARGYRQREAELCCSTPRVLDGCGKDWRERLHRSCFQAHGTWLKSGMQLNGGIVWICILPVIGNGHD